MEQTNYKTVHLQWIKKHPMFVPDGYEYFGSCPYIEIMTQLYSSTRVTNIHAKMLYDGDIQWKKKSEAILNGRNTSTTCFVTIGFNHQTWNVPACIAVIEKIKSFDWVKKFTGVFEFNRENGFHPHVHMIIETDLKKGKVIEKIWAAAGIKKVVLKKSFIDYKASESYHFDYIAGKKCDNKMPYVEADYLYRVANNIPHVFEK